MTGISKITDDAPCCNLAVPLVLQLKNPLCIYYMITVNTKAMDDKQGHKNAVTALQFMHEVDTWKRLLEFIQGENVFLKTRLAEVTREITDAAWLEQAELFQTRFLAEDDAIALLRRDVAELEAWLKREIFEDGSIIKEVRKKHRKLRQEIEMNEQRFNRLKFEFNNRLGDLL
jgi:hypothetical protein